MRTITAGSIGVFIALALAGCGGLPSAPPPDTSGLAALDAQATLAVWSARETAVADETRRSEQATVDAAASAARATEGASAATAGAIQAADATAAAYGTAVAVETTATAGAGFMAATVQSGAATATRDALAAEQLRLGIAATATADAAALAFQEAQAAKALAAKQAEIDRTAMWTRLWPWIVGIVAAAVGLALVLVAGTWAVGQLRRTRPQQAGDVWVMLGPGGPVALNRPALNRPPAQIPAELPPAPITVTSPVEPLPRLATGHVLIAGPTDAGKSTAMRALLAGRRNVVALDPHYTDAEGWGAAVRVIGAGRDYDAIRAYMDGMGRTLKERYEQRRDGRADFEPLTVAVDEMPSIVDAVGRDIAQTWRQWLREGRKVGLFLVLATQSTRVRTLGIEGERDLLENFSWVLALGETARREYPAAAAGLERPAVLVTKGMSRPVIIPHVRPEPSRVEGAEPGAALIPPPLVREKADPRAMRPEDADRIRELLAAGWSQRAVELELFGYNGGAAWETVARFADREAGAQFAGSREFPAAAWNPAP